MRHRLASPGREARLRCRGRSLEANHAETAELSHPLAVAMQTWDAEEA